MLEAIREKSQGWIAWTIVSIIALVFALWGIHSYMYGGRAEHIAAKVDKIKITQRQLSIAYNRLKRQQQIKMGSAYVADSKTNDALKQTALESLISAAVLNQAATRDGFRIAPEFVEVALAKMPAFQVNGEFSKRRFERILEGMLYSQDQFLSELRAQLLVNAVRSGIIQTEFSLPNEVEQAIQLINQKRSLDYFVIPSSQFLAQIKVSDSDIKKYYKDNQKAFTLPEKVSVQYLKLSVPDLMAKIHPTKDQLKQFYQDNILSYTQPKRWEIANILIKTSPRATDKQIKQAEEKSEHIAKLIKKGKSFSSLVKKYSEDLRTVDNNGVLPFATKAQLRSLGMVSIVDSLKKTGDISTPIKTDRGYEIVKLVATKPEKIHPYNSVKDKILASYKQRKAQKQFSDMSDQLANITYENPNSLDKAAKELNLPIKTTGIFSKAGGKDSFTKNKKIIDAAFDDAVLQGNNSDPINLNDDSVVVLRLKKHIVKKVKPLSSVKVTVLEKLKQDTIAKKAEDLGDSAIDAIKTKHKSIHQVAKEYRLIVHHTNDVMRHNHKVPAEILETGFKLPPILKKDNVAGVVLSNGDYVVIGLSAFKYGSIKSLTKKQQHMFHQASEQSFGMLNYQLYVQGLMKQAKIIRKSLDD